MQQIIDFAVGDIAAGIYATWRVTCGLGAARVRPSVRAQ